MSRLERGKPGEVRLDELVRIVEALCGQLDVVVRWRGGELDRLLNARHSALHEEVARSFARIDGWTLAPEVSFAIRGERGVIDILAWHAASRTLLVIELTTEIVDINELMGSVDRKRRLAALVARDRVASCSQRRDRVPVLLDKPAVGESKVRSGHRQAGTSTTGSSGTSEIKLNLGCQHRGERD